MIFVECNPDFVLVRTLGTSKGNVRHFAGKGTLCNRLRKMTGCKGLVDEDPLSEQPSYIREMSMVDCSEDVKKLQDKARNNILIMLCPRLEEWIQATVREAGRSLNDFHLPSNPRELYARLGSRPQDLEPVVREVLVKSRRLQHLRSLFRG